MQNSIFIEICGWVPAIIFPTASIFQLLALLRSESSAGVSVLTWLLFGIANLCTYIYIQKYLEPQTFGFLVAAAAQFAIVLLALKKREQSPAWRD